MKLALAAALVALAGAALAQAPPPPALTFATAGQGSAFLPYGQRLGPVIEASGAARIAIRETGGSIENLRLIEGDPATIGTVFLGSAHEGIGGTGFAQGRPLRNVVALFPMYETAFMAAALRSSGLTRLDQLGGKRVGVGPAGGPAEGYFRAAAEIAGVSATIVNGQPADLARQLVAGEIDALWQGAVVPVPSLVAATDAADAVVFGLTEPQVARMRERFPFMATITIPAGTYRGQGEALASVAAWNFVMAHREMPDATAYALTRAVMGASDLATRVGPAARGTRAENARTNSVAPFHPGAARALREAGARID